MAEIDNFVLRTLKLLDLERDAEIEETKALQEALPATELEKRGICLLRLTVDESVVGLGGRILAKLKANNGKPLPAHRFGTGDIVALRPSKLPDKTPTTETGNELSGIVYRTEEDSITVAFRELTEELEGTFTLQLLANDVTFRRLRLAMERLQKYSTTGGPALRLINVLFGLEEPAFGRPPQLEFANPRLNDPQRAAIVHAMAASDVALIHGPPGTGKTTTVVELIIQAVKRTERVLACAPSNVAIDNLLEKLAEAAPKLRLVRLGHPARLLPSVLEHSLDEVLARTDAAKLAGDVRRETEQLQRKLARSKNWNEKRAMRDELRELRKELKKREKGAVTELLRTAQVVLCTVTGADEKSLNAEQFDLVVIDEAAQALEAACWIPLLKGKRCVLAGDHRQLPPTIKSDRAARDGLGVTLFDRLIQAHNAKISRMLTVQYRMHTRIMDFFSRELYESKLQAHESVASHLLCDLAGVADTPETNVPLIMYDTAGCDLGEALTAEGDSKANDGEVDLVGMHVDKLIAAGLKPHQICVLTPYNAQVERLRARLKKAYPALEIGSVDGMQGREKEAVVLSLVRSNAAHEFGFLSDDRRTNVALTRARRHIAMVCDSETCAAHPFLKRLIAYMEEHAEYLSAEQFLPENRSFAPTKDTTKPTASAPSSSSSSSSKAPKAKPNKPAKQSLVPAPAAGKVAAAPPSRDPTADADKRAALRSELEAFLKQEAQAELAYPASLSSFDRLLVHELAQELGLNHYSKGEGDARHIVVAKKKAQQPPLPTSSSATPQRETKESKPAKVKQPPTHAQAVLLEAKAAAAAAAAEAEDEESEEDEASASSQPATTSSSSSKSKPQARKKKKKPTAPKPQEEPEDIDALLESYSTKNCGTKGCKNSVEILGRVCPFCRLKYCYNHGQPEVHGCGEESAKKARADWLNNNPLLAAASGKPKPPPLKADKREVLQRVLHKKIDKVTHAKPKAGAKSAKK